MNESHHWGWIAVAVLALAALAYIFTINRPDIASYANGAVHNEPHVNRWPLSINIGEGGCARIGRLEDMINTKTTEPKQTVKK